MFRDKELGEEVMNLIKIDQLRFKKAFNILFILFSLENNDFIL